MGFATVKSVAMMSLAVAGAMLSGVCDAAEREVAGRCGRKIA